MISIIAAIASETRALGKENKLLFRIPNDLKRFRSLTENHPIIMGRKTYESIGRALPKRTNIVISGNDTLVIPDVCVTKNLSSAIDIAKKATGFDEIFIIGGGQIYKEALPYADRIYLTVIKSDQRGDVFFPEYREFNTVISREKHTDPDSNLSYEFLTLER